MEVVGEAATGKEVVDRAAEIRPDAILMDIQMPGINGIEATHRIIEANPHVGVVVLTMFEDDDSVFSAMRAGARGYVLKGAEPAEILKVLRAVASGEAHFGPEIARRLMDFFSATKPASPAEAFPPSSPSASVRSSTSSPSCRSPTGRTLSSWRAKRGWDGTALPSFLREYPPPGGPSSANNIAIVASITSFTALSAPHEA